MNITIPAIAAVSAVLAQRSNIGTWARYAKQLAVRAMRRLPWRKP
jgi:hypothetical protein